MLDCIIIGSGPAGLSAALNLKNYQKDFVWFGSKEMSDKVVKAEKIANYPGLPMISGEELLAAFQRQMQMAGITITEKTVTNVMSAGDYYMVLADNELYEAKTIILSMGVMSGKPLDGEKEFLGRGVSYCATCDGMFYKGKNIAVVSGAAKYEHEVSYLAELAEKVYFFPIYKNAGVSADNVEICTDYPIGVTGSMKASGLTLRSGKHLPVDGIFLLRNAIAPSSLVDGLETTDSYIPVNRRQETNLPGCYAAGDCTGRPYQYTKAVGEGNVAAHSCIEYLAEMKKGAEKR